MRPEVVELIRNSTRYILGKFCTKVGISVSFKTLKVDRIDSWRLSKVEGLRLIA